MTHFSLMQNFWAKMDHFSAAHICFNDTSAFTNNPSYSLVLVDLSKSVWKPGPYFTLESVIRFGRLGCLHCILSNKIPLICIIKETSTKLCYKNRVLESPMGQCFNKNIPCHSHSRQCSQSIFLKKLLRKLSK